MGQAYKIFVSHASEDVAVAQLLSGHLERAGADYVLDAHHIDAGADFCEWMREEIRSSQELLVLLSPTALASECISFELGLATACNIWIAPILYRMDVHDLKKTKLGQSLLARRSVLTLEQFATYQSQLAERIAVHNSRPPAQDASIRLDEISEFLARARSKRVP
jgi:TIR domain